MSRFIEESGGLLRRDKRTADKRGGSRFYWTMLVLMLLTAAITASLCIWFASTKGAGEATEGSSSVNDTSTPDSSEEAPSSSEEETSSGVNSEMQLVLEAEQVFGNNSLDRNHAEAINRASTMQEMLSVYNDTLEAWRKQLNTMVTRLGTYTTEDQKALQRTWEEDTAEQIRQREDVLSSQGGTIGQVELAEYTCMLYRQRGLELFIELYRYDRTYTF